MRKHIHLEIDAVLVGTGARCLVVDADADLDERTPGRSRWTRARLASRFTRTAQPVSGGGPYVTVGPVDPD